MKESAFPYPIYTFHFLGGDIKVNITQGLILPVPTDTHIAVYPELTNGGKIT